MGGDAVAHLRVGIGTKGRQPGMRWIGGGGLFKLATRSLVQLQPGTRVACHNRKMTSRHEQECCPQRMLCTLGVVDSLGIMPASGPLIITLSRHPRRERSRLTQGREAVASWQHLRDNAGRQAQMGLYGRGQLNG